MYGVSHHKSVFENSEKSQSIQYFYNFDTYIDTQVIQFRTVREKIEIRNPENRNEIETQDDRDEIEGIKAEKYEQNWREKS